MRCKITLIIGIVAHFIKEDLCIQKKIKNSFVCKK